MNNIFYKEATELLNNIKRNHNKKDLKKIKIKNLEVIIKTISDYKPKSKIKQEEKLLIDYLNSINELDLNKTRKKELIIFQRQYIDPIIRKFLNVGFRFKYAWIFTLFFVFLFDLVLYALFEFFIPIFSLIFIFSQVLKELKASRENKLW